MILLTSTNYAAVQKNINEAIRIAGNIVGEDRRSDSLLSELDILLSDIKRLLKPATDSDLAERV